MKSLFRPKRLMISLSAVYPVALDMSLRFLRKVCVIATSTGSRSPNSRTATVMPLLSSYFACFAIASLIPRVGHPFPLTMGTIKRSHIGANRLKISIFSVTIIR